MMEDKIQILANASGYIDNIKIRILELTDKINSGQESNGMNLIVAVVEEVEKLIDAINNSTDLHKGNISIENMDEILREMIEAFENQDYVLVGDLFQYEFLPLLEKIQGNIREVISSK
ncbi:hypothetical protein [Clostridium sp. BL-8]|uniref:hypothetical protein n=1 Tax=Clostridium sp. BL-8 TaxID=349938 RepID=UPI00098BDFF8|nr:hypothetical protein [Clostridium sp. BL-8]OOM79975.1 hypothetical protein CLOBL_13430 [Clostridium sp. BL-8]